MSKLAILVLTAAYLFACEGDCYKCHSSLKGDTRKEHGIIAKCVECHKNSVGKQPKNETCGVDCFECHKPEKISQRVVEHKAIDNCIKCHSFKPKIGSGLFDNGASLLDNLRNK